MTHPLPHSYALQALVIEKGLEKSDKSLEDILSKVFTVFDTGYSDKWNRISLRLKAIAYCQRAVQEQYLNGLFLDSSVALLYFESSAKAIVTHSQEKPPIHALFFEVLQKIIEHFPDNLPHYLEILHRTDAWRYFSRAQLQAIIPRLKPEENAGALIAAFNTPNCKHS